MEINENFFQGSDEPELTVEQPTHAPFEPINQQVLVRVVHEDNSKFKTDTLDIVRPDKYREKSNRGYVLSVGNKVKTYLGKGDIVTYGKYNAEEILVDGEELILVHELDIRGVERAL